MSLGGQAHKDTVLPILNEGLLQNVESVIYILRMKRTIFSVEEVSLHNTHVSNQSWACRGKSVIFHQGRKHRKSLNSGLPLFVCE